MNSVNRVNVGLVLVVGQRGGRAHCGTEEGYQSTSVFRGTCFFNYAKQNVNSAMMHLHSHAPS